MFIAICDTNKKWHIVDQRNNKDNIIVTLEDKDQALKIRDDLNSHRIEKYFDIQGRRDNMSSPGDKLYEC